MSVIGSPPNFYSKYTSWDAFIVRLDAFFVVNDIDFDESKKKAFLLTLIEEECMKILTVVCPVPLQTKTFDEICELIQEYCCERKPNVYHERRTFYNATQTKNETVICFLDRIQRLAINCSFKDGNNEIILDRLIAGLKSTDIRDKICEMDYEKVTLNLVVKLAMDVEALASEKRTEAAKAKKNRKENKNTSDDLASCVSAE